MERKVFNLDIDNVYDFEDVELTLEERYFLGIAEYVRNEILKWGEYDNDDLIAKGLEYDEKEDSFYIPKGALITYNGEVGTRDNFIVEIDQKITDLYFNLKRPMKVSAIEETYTFEITETLQRQVVVVAHNADEARKIVEKRYRNNEITLDADDFVDYEIEEV